MYHLSSKPHFRLFLGTHAVGGLQPWPLCLEQRPTSESQRITLHLTQAAFIELHLSLAANFTHWY